MLKDILAIFGLNAGDYTIESFGSGLINSTWKLKHLSNDEAFILQQINKNVFKNPFQITENLIKTSAYVASRYPEYLFISALPTSDNAYLLHYEDGQYYRLLPYVANSVTINAVQTPKQAFEAAKQFARFAAVLSGFNIAELNHTIPDFHNLSYRYRQFEEALKAAAADRLATAKETISLAVSNNNIADVYQSLVQRQTIPLRVMHHDTKINNILFNRFDEGLCVIDLDTVMPGYFISDTGDMMRTYLSASNEEERDLSKIHVREEIFTALVKGYFSEMGSVLTKEEVSLFYYSGRFMMYMQALRFLTDYLNNDVYYGAAYPGHNLCRAANQFTLLEQYQKNEHKFESIVAAQSAPFSSSILPFRGTS